MKGNVNAEPTACVESPVDKSFMEGMQDASTVKPVKHRFGVSLQSVPNIAGKASTLHADRGA